MFIKLKVIATLTIVAVIILGLTYYIFRSHPKIIPGYINTDIRYISAEESGRLLSLKVNEGEPIKKGQALFLIDSSKNQTLLKSNNFLYHASEAVVANMSKGKRQPYIEKTAIDISSAKANLAVATKEYQRQKLLLKDDSTSRKQFEQAKSNYIQANNQVETLKVMQIINNLPARDDLRAAVNFISMFINSNSEYLQQKINSADVKALEDGYVYQIFYHKGEEVRAYSPVMTVINPKDVYIVFYLSKDDLSKIHLGEKINFETASGKSSEAKVSYISQKAEYTPPLLYGINSDSEISFEVHARVEYSPNNSAIYIGEPIKVKL
ncbi:MULTISPECIES: HlyD family secretion protein [Francisella]|uniref:MFP transporter n=1 Tax=Francisella opportunistica TaxID=2016517 RepID=A0A345JS70_9GAMM|nr:MULTISPECIES: HlyD family efflux transporter periplasmic adaptor subunit [Francisella]APC91927.1 Putative membrane fusion protein (MFP) component of efflux pump, membrane anchor protein YbhG [Francisella sp. MA067296]AXH30166.1 MFP transporter [Francisella opportunistica]AXH31808.1 MFP transporter [Francisella opportunistica]AXH33454.1 MFP transporter [Francisella opportunistica]